MRKQLEDHILSLSRSKVLKEAITEWALVDIYYSDTDMTCPCGQVPIREMCIINNRVTEFATEVGNICVNNFLNLPSKKLFTSLKYVSVDVMRSFNKELIDYAKRTGIITEWEYKFCLNIRGKKWDGLSDRQQDKKESVNKKILSRIIR